MKVMAAAVGAFFLLVLGLMGTGSTMLTSVPFTSDEQMELYAKVVQQHGLDVSPKALIAVDTVRFHQDFGQVTEATINQTADLFAICSRVDPLNLTSTNLTTVYQFKVPRSGAVTYSVSNATGAVAVRLTDSQGQSYPSGATLAPGGYVLRADPAKDATYGISLSMDLKACGREEIEQVMNTLGLQGDDRQMVLHLLAMGLQGDPVHVILMPGLYIWPVDQQWPITSPFGERLDPVTGEWAFHTGVDIGAPWGTAVHSAMNGTVSFAGWDGNYGQAVLVTNAGVTTIYGHLSQIQVAQGQVITQNQVIGLTGSTGKSTGPHLHFEWRLGDTPVDPMLFYNVLVGWQ